jgi:hypothetical protein
MDYELSKPATFGICNFFCGAFGPELPNMAFGQPQRLPGLGNVNPTNTGTCFCKHSLA